LVGSEDSIPGDGNPYDSIINRLTANPAQDVTTFAIGIVQDFVKFYSSINHDNVQLSVIDLSNILELHHKIQETAAMLNANMDRERIAIQNARDAAPYFGDANNRDLIRFAEELAVRASDPALKVKALELASSCRKAVIANKVYNMGVPLMAEAAGMTIYLPTPSQVSSAEVISYGAILASNSTSNMVSGGVSWADMVIRLVTGTQSGGPSQVLTSGNFAYYISWDNPEADLDLLINEPRGTWGGPMISPTSPNAFSSSDSYYSHTTTEYYTALSLVEQGQYHVLVRYYGCAQGYASCGPTTVKVYRYDPLKGDQSYTLQFTRVMDHVPALPSLSSFGSWESFITAVSSKSYADWFYAQYSTRDLAINGKSTLLPLVKTGGKGLVQFGR
jgi:hypothetical protein